MTVVQDILHTFDQLSDTEKQEVALEILRRSRHLKTPPLTDEELTHQADELFLELDHCEAADRRSINA